MVYDLTEKLNFSEDPVITIKDTRLTVKTDAENVLKLIDVLSAESDEISGIVEAVKLLFSVEDQKKLKAMKLKAKDYFAVVRTAVKLALGKDPDEDDMPGE